jgi:hypothetical protein
VPPGSVSLTNVTVAVAVPDAAAGGAHTTGTALVPMVIDSAGLNVQLVPPLQPSPVPNLKNAPPAVDAI